MADVTGVVGPHRQPSSARPDTISEPDSDGPIPDLDPDLDEPNPQPEPESDHDSGDTVVEVADQGGADDPAVDRSATDDSGTPQRGPDTNDDVDPVDEFAREPAHGGPDLARSLGWLLALVGFVVGARTLHDNSFLTHLATGRLILDQRAVPTADPYSYIAAGEPWTVQSWLVSILYATLETTLGGWSIRVVNGLAGAGIVLGLWRLVTPARQLLARVGLVGVALLIGASLWSPRPLLFGLVLVVITLQVIQGLRPRWWLLPVFWLWVNSHGSFVLGAGLVGAVMVGAAIDQRRLPWTEIRMFAITALGCVAAIVNPLQWHLLWFPIRMMTRGEALDGVIEWRSPTFRSPTEVLFLALVPVVVLAARRSAPWRSLVPAIAFMAAGFMAVRNVGIAAVVVVALLAPWLADLGGSLVGAGRGLVPRAMAGLAAAGGAVMLVAIVLSPAADLEEYPIEHVDWLEARSLVADPQVRLVQRDFVGNYLTLRYGPDARVFMDDRFDFYPQQVIDDHNALLLGGDAEEIMGRNGFDVVLWAAKGPLRRWVDSSSEWDVVRSDDDWFVACRVTSPVYARCSG